MTSNEDVDLVTVEDLDDYVPRPENDPSGTAGYVLRTNGDGTTQWADEARPTDTQTQNAVNAWMESHSGQYVIPDGNVTTAKIADEAIIEDKLSDDLKLKAIKDYVTPEMFGAVGDGTTDDTAAIASALAVNDGDVTVIFTKRYVSGEILVNSNNKLFFNNGSELIQKGGNDIESYIFIRISGKENVVIDGATIIGNYGNYQSGSFDEWADLLQVREGSKHVKITNCTFKNSVGDGLEVCAGTLVASDIPEDVAIYNCKFENIGGCSFAVTGGKNVVLRDSILESGKRIMPKCGIDLEPNAEDVGNDNILISGIVHVGEENTQGIFVNPWSENVTLENVVTNKIIAIGNTQSFAANKAKNVTVKNCKMKEFTALNADDCSFTDNIIRGAAILQYCNGTRFAGNDISNDAANTLTVGNLLNCVIDGNYIHGTPTGYAIECSNGNVRENYYKLSEYFFIISNNIIINTTSYAIDAHYGVLFINNIFTDKAKNGYYFPTSADYRVYKTCRVIDTLSTSIRVINPILINSYFKKGDRCLLENKTGQDAVEYFCTSEGYYAYFQWAVSTAVIIGDSIRVNNYVYTCSQAGTTGSTQPTFTTTVGDEITDGTAKWKCMGAIASFSTIKLS